MTVGSMMICAGAALLAAALLITIAAAVTAPAKAEKMKQKMREKY